MKKHLKLLFLCLCLLYGALLFVNNPVEAKAASYSRTDRETKVGKYYVWGDYNTNTLRVSKSKTGKGSVLARPSKGRSIGSPLSNGSTVYYVESKPTGDYNYVSYLYCIKINGKGKTYLGKIKSDSYPVAYYKGNLYLVVSDKNDCTYLHTYQFNIKKKKCKRIMKGVKAGVFVDKYLIGTPNTGDYCPLPLYSYNCKTGKKVKITARCACYDYKIIGNKIYYAELLEENYSSPNVYRIRRCSFSGKDKHTVVPKIKASYIGKITTKYIYYEIYHYQGYTSYTKYYRYNIKTKRAERIKKSLYKEY